MPVILIAAVVFSACGAGEEIDADDIAAGSIDSRETILERTVSRPGGEAPFRIGQVGGIWTSSINNDPRTFNTLTARDADSRTVIDPLYDFLADYDPYTREFTPALASFEVEADEANDSLRVVYTLRDELYWTTPDSSPDTWVQVTSDDVVYWYNEIDGDRSLQLPGYSGQFIDMPDGSAARIEIEKIDDRSFAFIYPRIVSNPILSTNMQFGPRYIFQPAKEENGSEGVLDLFSVDTPVRTIPAVGEYHIVEYDPGVRVVLQRNPNYWKTDEAGTSLPYMERVEYRVVPDKNSEFLMFRDGSRDSYSARPEDLDSLLVESDPDYTVYNGGAALGSAFFTFNQNPDTLDPLKYSWFSQTEFRQAMSSMLNRERIVRQVYRGLAEPAHHFFARANPMFDEDIQLEYTFNPDQAVELLKSIGMSRDAEGTMRDAEGNAIDFTINLGAENNIGIDIAQIFADELSEIGVRARVRPIDFQRVVEMLTNTYDWEVVTVSLGANYWPSGGSNVWQSGGNFHLWNPLQDSPATEWEARIDYLYNEGRFTIDQQEAKGIYDEFQSILLAQLPVMYVVHPWSFLAVRDRWQNVRYDTLDGLRSERLFLE
ncbi:MAG: ABC transporter substrate-binding protein [Spirochaeta sp.]|nr:ABC transporter substrate-binding protein [Spirochaeta sp.]